MVENKKYLIYKGLKEGLCVNYKTYDMKYVMSKELLFYAYDLYQPPNTKELIRNSLFRSKDVSPLFDLLPQNKVIFTISIPGKDHISLVESTAKSINEGYFLDDNFNDKKYISFTSIFISFFQIFFNRHYRKVPRKDKFYFYLKLVFFKNLIDQLESYNGQIKTRGYVASFCGNKESLYCWFFQKRNVPTYCLQHALHPPRLDYKTFVPADVVSIENLNADYMLGWGEYTKEALIKEGFSEKKYKLAGNPKYANKSEIKVQNEKFNTCIVCLPRDIYLENNFELLNIASQLKLSGIEVYIKLHPRCDVSKYKSLIDELGLTLLEISLSLIESISQYKPDFVIVYNSTVYYEYYLNDILSFRYSVNENDIPFGLSDDFSDFDTLIKRIEEFKNYDNIQLNKEINKIIGRFCALGVNNYAEILNV